jgi:hypothetical protein
VFPSVRTRNADAALSFVQSSLVRTWSRSPFGRCGTSSRLARRLRRVRACFVAGIRRVAVAHGITHLCLGAGVARYAEFPVYGDQDGVLDDLAAHVTKDSVVVVHYGVGADADSPVKGKALTHKVRATLWSAVAARIVVGVRRVVVPAPLTMSRRWRAGRHRRRCRQREEDRPDVHRLTAADVVAAHTRGPLRCSLWCCRGWREGTRAPCALPALPRGSR